MPGSSIVRKPSILLIHPDLSYRDEATACLAQAGYHVCHALGRRDGLHLLYALHPDLVVLQVAERNEATRREDGWDTLARIRLFTDTPVILVGPQITSADRAHTQGLPSVAFLDGAFSPEQLRASVAQALGDERPIALEPPPAVTGNAGGLSHRLNAAQLMQVDRALGEIGELGEVRLIKQRGALRFIAKIKTERYRSSPT
ncbi:MAG: hypothetical protein HY782_08765 [Chloroflexi bacterium]|nr:hypothetical protein [Chloroflexota bacterium]